MIKVGILGGGQLGRMLLEAATKFEVETHILENQENCPARLLCDHFTLGDIKDFDTVYQFGKKLDCITIEIEQVCVEALEKLEEEGINVIPRPAVLRIIQNKITQKEFYTNHNIPTSPYHITNQQKELLSLTQFLPAVHKIGVGGYDGKGVVLLKTEADLTLGFDAPSVLEKMAEIEKEIAIQVAVASDGSVVICPAVEMVFNPRLNLLDYQLCPAILDQKITEQVLKIASNLVRAFNSPGIFAVELFVDKSGTVLVNETAPRVHNSGHHSIEALATSQFELLWQVLLNIPLGPTEILSPSIMVNIIGADGHSGKALLEGKKELSAKSNLFLHWYGKSETKPGRKMGHVTALNVEPPAAAVVADWIKKTIRSIAKEN
ncbi:MAG: 5-(carboxyamino)imidazole ribonucleotide synthase [Bacteroidota bacterium]